MNISKKILVTGASGGIGKAIVERIGQKNTFIALHYNSNKESVDKLAKEISKNGATPILLKADLSQESGRLKLIKELHEKMDGCNILINNAGGLCKYNENGIYSEKEAFDIIGLNFLAPFFLCQAFVNDMCNNNYGRIINISSIGVKFGGGPKSALYSASKSALESLTKNLSRRGAERNVLVNAIRVGVTDTDFHKMSPEKDLSTRVNLIPMKKLCSPVDIAYAVEFLLSDMSSYITGQIIPISGGE